MPEGHSLHSARPVNSEYVPAGHGLQSVTLTPPILLLNVAGGQKMQPDDVCPPCGLYVPTLHSRHTLGSVAPGTSL